MKNILKNRKGITLIEIIVTLAIVGIIVVPISTLFISTARTNKFAEDKMEATALAQNYMERVKASTDVNVWDNIINTEGKFKVEIDINKYSKYNFPQETSGDSIEYDYRIEVQNKDIKLYNSSENDLGVLATINSSLDKDIEMKFTYEDNKVDFSVVQNDISIITESVGWTGDIKIKIDIVDILNVEIEGINESNDNMIFYIAKSNQGNIIYSTKEGKIRWYNNIALGSGNVSGNNISVDSRVYGVTVTVKKDGEILEQLKGTKSVLR